MIDVILDVVFWSVVIMSGPKTILIELIGVLVGLAGYVIWEARKDFRSDVEE